MNISKEQINNFFSKIDIRSDGECWNWMRSLDKGGYGRVKISGKTLRAHRIAYQIQNGEINSTMLVLHSCDNPKCCNPSHLHIGTHKDNMREMFSRNRRVNISSTNIKKLNPILAQAIRKLLSNGASKRIIEKSFNVSRRTLRSLIKNEIYKETSPTPYMEEVNNPA